MRFVLLLWVCCIVFPLHAEEPPLTLRSSPSLVPQAQIPDEGPVFLSADTLEGNPERELEARGKVELRKQGQALFADQLFYDPQKNEVRAQGNVRVEQQGDVITGPELRLTLDTRIGYFNDTRYQLAQRSARGQAQKILFEGQDLTRFQEANYTTCPIGQDDWFLRVGELEINRSTQIGTAHNASIIFKGVPLLYTPWMTFSLNNQRKSGLLAPTFGSSDSGGLELTLPYYWNIAPDRDATFAPRLLSKRGLQLNSEYRYLDLNYRGQAELEFLPQDRITKTNRYAAAWRHSHNFGLGWTGNVDFQKVSDDTYFTDLSTRIANTSKTNLPQDGSLSYVGGPWNFLARLQRFQTLQDPLAPVVPPYHRLPQLVLNGSKLDAGNLGFRTDLNLASEFVNFSHPTLATGQRLTVYPSVSFPFTRSYGYVTPKLGFHFTHYNLDKPDLPRATRSLPIVSVDSGLFFERKLSWRGQEYQQTLEPRLYYLFIPYRDQSKIPNFDSAETDFNLAQMFTENQFSGGDRINDANQFTVALTSRLLETNGQEMLRGTIAQRFYLSSQRVTLASEARTRESSDVLAAISARIFPAWVLEGGVQYNTHQSRSEKLSAAVRYQPEAGKVLNLGYRFTRNTLEQVDISTQWPIFNNVYGLMRWNYSVRDHKILEALVGLEYNAGCWSLRTVAHRFATATGKDSDSIFIQLELNGVSRLGSNPLDVLRQNISGYTKSEDIPHANTFIP